MSKKYIENAFFIERAMYHDNEFKDYFLKWQVEEIGSSVIGLLTDGQPYICELAIGMAENELQDEYIVKMRFSYKPLVQCGTCRFYEINPTTGHRCKKHNIEMVQSDYCSYGEGINEFKVQI